MTQNRVVTLSIKAKVPFLRGINNKTVETITGITWRELFKTKFNLDINPAEFIVQRVGEFSNKTSSLNAPISDLISAFAKMRKEYRVDVVRNSNKSLESSAKDQSKTPKAKRGRPRKVKTLPTFFEESPSQPPRKFFDRLDRNSGVGTQKIPPQIPSTSSNMNMNCIIIEGDDIKEDNIEDAMDDDDNASMCTTATEDLQELIKEHGIIPVDIKSKIMQELRDNISNSQLLVIQKEIKELKCKKKTWNRYAKTASQTNILLTAFFLD